MPVSVLVTVTSAPGMGALLVSRTTPDNCDPAIACACAGALATKPSRRTPTSVRSTLTTAPPLRGTELFSAWHVSIGLGRTQRSYGADTVTSPSRGAMTRDNPDVHMEPWRTAIVDAGPTHIRVRGHDVLALMREATFTDL